MYCQTCGNQINDELSFCNRCGNRVANSLLAARGADGNASAVKSLSIATGFVGIIGLGGLIALMTILIVNHVEGAGVVILSFLFAATVFGICFMMTRQISRLAGLATSSLKPNFKLRRGEPAQLNPIDAASEFQPLNKPFCSVTESTTRTLDKINI